MAKLTALKVQQAKAVVTATAAVCISSCRTLVLEKWVLRIQKDGKLSASEFVTAHSLKFEAIDTDRDGFITDEEIADYVARGRS